MREVIRMRSKEEKGALAGVPVNTRELNPMDAQSFLNASTALHKNRSAERKQNRKRTGVPARAARVGWW